MALTLREHPSDLAAAHRLLETVELLTTLSLDVDVWRTQELFYETLEQVFDVSRPGVASKEQIDLVAALGKALRVRLPV